MLLLIHSVRQLTLNETFKIKSNYKDWFTCSTREYLKYLTY